MIASFSVCQLTHWAAWGDLLLIWKHNYYLPARGNCFVLLNSTITNTVIWFLLCYTWVDVIFIGGVVLVLVCSNAFIIKLRWYGYLCQITCRWCISILSWYNNFLECWSGYFDRLYLKELPISLPMLQINTIKRKIWEIRISEKYQQIEKCDFLMNDQNIMFG